MPELAGEYPIKGDEAFSAEAKESQIEPEGIEFSIVKDYKIPGKEERGQHELLAEAMGQLIHKIKEGHYASVVFLDKAARPLVTMLQDMWPYNFDANGKLVGLEEDGSHLPTINFLNVGTETEEVFTNYFTGKKKKNSLISGAEKQLQTATAAKDNLEETILAGPYSRAIGYFRYQNSWLGYLEGKSEEEKKEIENIVEIFSKAKDEVGHWKDLESRVRNEGYFIPQFVEDNDYARLMSLITNDMTIEAVGKEKLQKLVKEYALFKNSGPVLIVDEYSNTGQSLELAKKVIEAGMALKDKNNLIDGYNFSDERRSYLFTKEDGFRVNPPWRESSSQSEMRGVTGVVDPAEGELTAEKYGRENPEAAKRVQQLRAELHAIANKYLEKEKERLT